MDNPGFHFDRYFVVAIGRVKMGSSVLTVKHADHDAEKSGDFGH